jgi:hypothetical protein
MISAGLQEINRPGQRLHGRRGQKVTQAIAVSRRTMRILRAHARHIQRLGRRAIGDVVEIGRRLTDAKRRLGHGRFLVWLATEFGWSERTAEHFMRVYDLHGKFANFADLDVPLSALYLLAALSTPDKALFAIAERAGTGAGLSLVEVREIIANSRRASPIRQRIHIAKQIWKEVQDRPLADVRRIIETRLADLQDDERRWVQGLIYERCMKSSDGYSTQASKLENKIKWLDELIDYVRPTWLRDPAEATSDISSSGRAVLTA